MVLIDDDTQSFFALSCFWIVLISLTHFSHFVTSILYWLVAISPFRLCGRLLFYFLSIPSPHRLTRMRFLACYACTLVWLFVYLINSSSEDSTCIQVFLSTFFFLLVNLDNNFSQVRELFNAEWLGHLLLQLIRSQLWWVVFRERQTFHSVNISPWFAVMRHLTLGITLAVPPQCCFSFACMHH